MIKFSDIFVVVMTGLSLMDTQTFASDTPSPSAEANQTNRNASDILKSNVAPSHWRIFGGAALGSGWISSQEYSNAPSGSQLFLSARLSYQLPHWEFEGGLGWMKSELQGETSDGVPILIQTRSGFSDLSARYRFNKHWELGPVAHFSFGTDTTLSPVFGTASLTAYVGIKAVYEVSVDRFPLQFYSQLLMDEFSGSGRSL